MSTSNGDRPKGPETGPPAGNSSAQTEPNPNNRGQHQNYNSPPPQPAMGYPPVMGYPPPGSHPPTGPYPPSYNPYTYPPAATGYYPSPNPYQHPPQPYMHHPPNSIPRRSPIEGFIRGVVTAILIIIIVTCLLSIVTFILFRPMLPEYHLTSFSVTNFNITNGMLAGNWDATMSVHNPNPNQKARLDRIKSYVYHGNMVNYLSSGMVQPFSLGTNATSTIQVRSTMANQLQPPEWIVTAIGEEREGGTVTFQMAVTMVGTFKSEIGWTTHLSMMAYCEDLAVKFPNKNAGSGNVSSSDLPKKCMIFS